MRDPLQKRLKEMERRNPSENSHRQGFLKSLKDRVYFLYRSISNQVEMVPQRQGIFYDYSVFNYNPNAIWYDRLNALRNLARKGKPKNSQTFILDDLNFISNRDPDYRVRGLAKDMVDSYATHRDFSDTIPYIEMLAEKRRRKTKLQSQMGYNPNDIWYNRLRVLETTAKVVAYQQITKAMYQDLKTIARRDDDERIRRKAGLMARSIRRNGDFSDT